MKGSIMKKEAGFALIATLLIMVVVAILVFGTNFTTLVDRRVSANQLGSTTAYYIAQSGLQEYKTHAFRNMVEFYASGADAWCEGNGLDTGIETGVGVLLPGESTGPMAFGGGTYDVTYDVSGDFLILTSVGLYGNARSTVQLVATTGAGRGGAWDNAIFATGRDEGAKAIVGNVTVYGSVHVVEGQVDIDDELLTDVELSGSAGIFNDYRGQMNSSGGSTANSDVRTELSRVTGENYAFNADLPNLCAKVKIESGSLILGGSAKVGNDLGNSADPFDGKAYSVHLGDGKVYRRTGQNLTEIANHHTSEYVNLRYPEGPGMNSDYAQQHVPWPILPENYPNDVGFMVDPTQTGCEWLFQEIDGQTVFALPPVADNVSTCSDGTNSISWVPGTPSYFTIEGSINTGAYSVQLSGPLYYEGAGSIRAGTSSELDEDITVDVIGLVEPLDQDYVNTDNTTGALTGSALGLVSGGTMFISNSPGETAAVLAYAAGEIDIDKQSVIAGAVVAQAFDMGVGQQVPKVAYHPGVRSAAEALCMPGTDCSIVAGGGTPALDSRAFGEVSYERR